MSNKKSYPPFTENEAREYLKKLDNEFKGIIKGNDLYIETKSVKRYSRGDIESKILVKCLLCGRIREVRFKDWKLQLKHLSRCSCVTLPISYDPNTYIYRDYNSKRYIYLGKGKKSNGIQYIWLLCRECGAIIEVDGSKYLKGELFKTCFCFNPTPMTEKTLDLFTILKGFVKYSKDKIGCIIGTDLLLGEGKKKYTVSVQCTLCGKIRDVSAEEYFNERTNNYNFCSCISFKREFNIGSRFGHLTLNSWDENYYYCTCDCGNKVVFEKKYFNLNRINSCGKNCKLNKYTSQFTDATFVGQQFNNFKVLNILQRETFNNDKLQSGTYWNCECLKCGSRDIYILCKRNLYRYKKIL